MNADNKEGKNGQKSRTKYFKEHPAINLRVRRDIHTQLEERAEKEGLSLNKFAQNGLIAIPGLMARIEQLSSELDQVKMKLKETEAKIPEIEAKKFEEGVREGYSQGLEDGKREQQESDYLTFEKRYNEGLEQMRFSIIKETMEHLREYLEKEYSKGKEDGIRIVRNKFEAERVELERQIVKAYQYGVEEGMRKGSTIAEEKLKGEFDKAIEEAFAEGKKTGFEEGRRVEKEKAETRYAEMKNEREKLIVEARELGKFETKMEDNGYRQAILEFSANFRCLYCGRPIEIMPSMDYLYYKWLVECRKGLVWVHPECVNGYMEQLTKRQERMKNAQTTKFLRLKRPKTPWTVKT
ncbi:MAG: toxin-antitoxin system HicB family antitoxin [Candidatus Parvarchaeota archaeon]